MTNTERDQIIAMARDESTPPEVLARLARDEDPGVRGSVARNPNTALKVLVKLAGDKHGSVRRDAIRNPSIPPVVLEALTYDWDLEERQAEAVFVTPFEH